jgi:hypothetical protein
MVVKRFICRADVVFGRWVVAVGRIFAFLVGAVGRNIIAGAGMEGVETRG